MTLRNAEPWGISTEFIRSMILDLNHCVRLDKYDLQPL